jgi:hypothetical protein
VKHRRVGCLAWINAQLLEQSAHSDPCALVTDANADRSIFVMHAHGNDRMFEARVADAGHREQQLARKKARTLHPLKMPLARRGRKP